MLQKKTSKKSNLLGWLFCVWSFNGFFRNLVPSLSEPLYLAHVPIVLLIILKTIKQKNVDWQARTPSWSLALVFVAILTWQSVTGTVSERQIIYVSLMYILGVFSVPFVADYVSRYSIDAVVRVLPYVVFVNLIASLNQIFFKTGFFLVDRINEAPLLGTSRNVLRATGTFTSPGAYALFVSISLAIFLWSLKSGNGKKFINLITGLALGFMIVFSGSRSLLLYVILAAIVAIIFSGFDSIKILVPFFVAVLIPITVSAITFLSSFLSPVLYAFLERIEFAPYQENTSQRVWDAFFGFTNHLGTSTSLHGEGLGSRTNAILGYQSPSWIEEELTRVTIEGGPIAGLFFIGFRLWLLILIAKKILSAQERNVKFVSSFIFGSFVSTLLVGPIIGQGSTSVYFILVMGILLGLTTNQNDIKVLKN